ncbi:MAG TPA: response regulator [Myxococcota bacterium]|jgi:two-component system response regulator|nr:response regulator [Myxococcota bacterium]
MTDHLARDIVLVEDDGNDLAVALRAFRRGQLDGKVQVLRDGAAALEYLRDVTHGAGVVRPKVVFLDLKMPKVDGLSVLRELRADERTRRIPVVVVSSSDRDNDVREAYRLGANSYLVKRFDPARPGGYLVDAARYWLDLNRP